MADPPRENKVDTLKKRAKDKVRKSGSSVQRKVLQLGEYADVFSAVVYFNPTYGRLDGAIHVPEGQEIPDMNKFLAELLLGGSHSMGSSRGPRRAQSCRQPLQDAQASSIPIHDNIAVETGCIEIHTTMEMKAGADPDVPQINSTNRSRAKCVDGSNVGCGGPARAIRDTDNRTQPDRHMADGSPILRNTSRCVVKEEMPDGAVGDGVSGAHKSVGSFHIGTHDVSDMVVAGNKTQTGRSDGVHEWEAMDAQDMRAQTARVTRPGLSRRQAAKVQRFLQQVSLHMRLASSQERLPPYRVAHRDRWRNSSQRNRWR